MRAGISAPRGRPAAAALALVLAAALAGCTGPGPEEGGRVLDVPGAYPTIQAAVDAAQPGDLVLVAPGSYEEQIEISTPELTIRGADRNTVVVDGSGLRPYGIVSTADGTRIENLTVQRATFYGVLITGLHDADGAPSAHDLDDYETLDPGQHPPVQRFGISHVTAANNGLYGIYAFDAQHGYIRDSYASGSSDSGIYVGQCRDCDVLVQGNVAERNAVGFENANASDSVYVVGNRFAGNRIGLTLLSDYREAFAPQRANTLVGNAVLDNDAPDSPAHAEGGFGIGVGISGGQENRFARNLIAGNPLAGVLLSNTEDLPALGNLFESTAFAAEGHEGNGVDVANTSAGRAPAAGNCVEGSAPAAPVTAPAGLLESCGASAPQPSTTPAALPQLEIPPGTSFLRVPAPPAQPTLPSAGLREPPPPLPASVELPELDAVPLPAPGLLADRAALR